MHAGTAGVERRLELPDGRTLTVRHGLAEDLVALRELFDGLSVDDRYRRFFSGCPPPEEHVARMLQTAASGGVQLVVDVAGPGDALGRIVGEASYSALPDGDGDLGITVASAWRGWLGTYLLDTLAAVARRSGVPNLEADIVATNRPMLALARRRGCVSMGHEDLSFVRVLMSTGHGPPTWPGAATRPRLLVEGGGARWRGEAEARALDLDVLVCPGPGPSWSCPELEGGVCPLAADADAIVDALSDPVGSRLAAAHERGEPGVPVCMDVGGGDVDVVVRAAERSARRHAANRLTE